MRTARPRNHWTVWLAAWAILLGALAPSMTHWLNQRQASRTLPSAAICTSGKHKAASRKGAMPDAPGASGHCGFCLPHDGGQGLPPVVALSLPPLPYGAVEPALFLQAPVRLFAWVAAQPRAPPQV
ncbi:MAG: DUF2946 domain-containing protein [Acidobacteriota bacterium]